MRNPIQWLCRRTPIRMAAAVIAAASLASPIPGAQRVLTIDDVFELSRIDHLALSPDGKWAVVVVQRAARPGEVYGRTLYELDPSRGDVWLISRHTGERRNLTQGANAAAGFWCATWSPDGSKLAMLSTKAEGGEPRGGDNVRLYVWDRETDRLNRLSDAAMMTQTMGGSPMYRMDLRGGADESTIAHRCSDEENAPFAWLDNRRLLAVTLPSGGVSGLLDAFSRPVRHASETLRKLHDGIEPTVSAVGSGAERVPQDERTNTAVLQTIDVESRAAVTISAVPTFPFAGELTLSIAPDGRQIGVLATIGTVPPTRAYISPHRDDAWSVEKRLGFVDVAPGASMRWAAAPAQAQYPLDLYGWSPDSRKLALRARSRPDSKATQLYVASSKDLSLARVGPATLSIGGTTAGSAYPTDLPVLWIDDRQLLAQGVNEDGQVPATKDRTARADWWLLGLDADAVNLTMAAPEPPSEFRRSTEGRLFTLAGGKLLHLDVGARKLEPTRAEAQPVQGAIVWPRDKGRETAEVVVATTVPGGKRIFRQISLGNGVVHPRRAILSRSAQLLAFDPASTSVFSREPTAKGLFLSQTFLANGDSHNLLSLDTHLAAIDWGRKMLIDYRSADGQALKAAVILPPGYKAGRRYPTIAWVYAGYRVDNLDDYFLDPYLPGIYNLQLYASHGYVVLIPSMPPKQDGQKNDLYLDVSNGSLPAVDRLIELGITDPERVGAMGQSFGGYSVYSLVSQTKRFKAAIAMSGFVDLTAFYTQFDPAARGYQGIEHEKSYNWSIAETGPLRLGVPPYEDYSLYWRNSPLAFVDRVETPLLLIHGEYDSRGPMSQAESFFYSLYRQGKTARLLRYWGENHGLSQSPANVRNIFEETLRWFDKYLGEMPRLNSRSDVDRPSPEG